MKEDPKLPNVANKNQSVLEDVINRLQGVVNRTSMVTYGITNKANELHNFDNYLDKDTISKENKPESIRHSRVEEIFNLINSAEIWLGRLEEAERHITNIV